MKKSFLYVAIMALMFTVAPQETHAQSLKKGNKAVSNAEKNPTNLQPSPEEEVLSKLTFTSYDKYIRPTKNDINIRKAPSTSAPIVDYGFGAQPYIMFPVISENQGWYKTPVGWISKSVSKVTTNNPITPQMMNTEMFGYTVDMDLWCGWRVYSPIGSQQLAVADCCGKLYLGKIINNVFVFKYAINASFQYDEENKKRFEVRKENFDGTIMRNIYVGTDLCVTLPPVEGLDMTRWVFDFSRLNDKILLMLFKDVIEANETEDYYISSELLEGEFSNFFNI